MESLGATRLVEQVTHAAAVAAGFRRFDWLISGRLAGVALRDGPITLIPHVTRIFYY